MSKHLFIEDRRKLSNDITNAISKWALDRFGDDRSFPVTNYLRGLAKQVVCLKGHPNRLVENSEEAKDVMEAAQDFMELADSIRYKMKHKGE